MRGHVGGATTAASSNGPGPVCRFINIELCGGNPGSGVKGRQGTVLLENPSGEYACTFQDLVNQVSV